MPSGCVARPHGPPGNLQSAGGTRQYAMAPAGPLPLDYRTRFDSIVRADAQEVEYAPQHQRFQSAVAWKRGASSARMRMNSGKYDNRSSFDCRFALVRPQPTSRGHIPGTPPVSPRPRGPESEQFRASPVLEPQLPFPEPPQCARLPQRFWRRLTPKASRKAILSPEPSAAAAGPRPARSSTPGKGSALHHGSRRFPRIRLNPGAGVCR